MQVLSSYHPARAGVSVVEPQPRPQGPAPDGIEDAPPSNRLLGSARLKAAAEGTAESRSEDTAASATSMKYRRSERTALFIETQEGDVIRLKFKSRESVDLKTAHAQGGGESSSEITLTTRSASKLSVTVRGDLNVDELGAIQEAIEQASELADDFFDGDLQAAFASASEFDIDGDQLASVNLKMRSTERFTYSSYGYRATPAIQVPAIELRPHTESGPAPAAKPALDAAESAEHAASPVPAELPVVDENAPLSLVTPGESEIAAPVEADSAAGPSRAQDRYDAFRAIGSFLTRLMDSFGADAGKPSTGLIDMSIKLRVFEATLMTLSQTQTQDESPVHELVHETLDALAAQEADPVNQVA